MRVASSEGPGGVLVRRLALPTILAPMLVGVAVARFFVGLGVEEFTFVTATLTPLAAQASQRLGCTVHRQFLTEIAFPDARFDVVTMYDLIEHLQDPRSDLEQVFRIVKPGGVFFILTPNDEAFLRRISKMLYRLSFHSFDEPMRRLYYPDHLSYFTAESLSQLLCRAGFELVSLESVNQELSRLELSPLQKLVVKVILQIGRPFRSSGGKLVAYAGKA